MNIQLLQTSQPGRQIFTVADAQRWFPDIKPLSVEIQLHRWEKSGLLRRIARGIYSLVTYQMEEFAVAAALREPSYISLESALNAYGMLPDVPQGVTSVTTSPSRRYATSVGVCSYHQLAIRYFFGFEGARTPLGLPYRIATPEKALLDYLTAHRLGGDPVRLIEDERLRRPTGFSSERFLSYLPAYPQTRQRWLRRFAAEFANITL